MTTRAGGVPTAAPPAHSKGDVREMRLENYGLIGNLRTAALVGLDGSIDWLCLPRFDSGACFAHLLGDERNGRWRIAPAGQIRHTSRRDRQGTLMLETDFETDEGAVRVVDCMPPGDGSAGVVRVVEGLRGRVPMRMELVIRLDYGSTIPWVQRTDSGIVAFAGPDALSLRTPLDVRGEDRKTLADFTIGAGERLPLMLSWHPSPEHAPEPVEPLAAVDMTDAWWREWSGRCTYEGAWSDEVRQSLIVLKALTFEATGGIVAAPTTSLPEEIGGVRNWDYRYCWLRDAALTLDALMLAGYLHEALPFRDWATRASAGDPPSSASCTASPASAGCPSRSSSGSPATRAPYPCASATPPPTSSSSTSTER
jgi:GH15 family glucan-1,4-alpha-glucosidase